MDWNPWKQRERGSLQTLILMMSSVHGLEPIETKREGEFTNFNIDDV